MLHGTFYVVQHIFIYFFFKSFLYFCEIKEQKPAI